MYFLALLIDGALSGAIYALIALAFVLVYKASSMVNFALGEWIMFGALLMATGLNVLQLGIVGALLFASAAMIVLAALFNRFVVRYLVGRPAITAIMVTLALGMVMRGSARPLFADVPGLLPPALFREPLALDGLVVPADKLLAAAIATLCTGLIAAFYRYSRTGLALRALADDPQVAMASGIDVDRHLLIVWALVAVVSVVAGTLWVLVTGGGFSVALVGLKVFPIVIIGGLDSVPGTIVAALLIGLLESLSAGYLADPVGAGFNNIVPWLALLAMLALRPHGLFGQPRIERV